jgi:hypothetical protein
MKCSIWKKKKLKLKSLIGGKQVYENSVFYVNKSMTVVSILFVEVLKDKYPYGFPKLVQVGGINASPFACWDFFKFICTYYVQRVKLSGEDEKC